MIWISIKDKLPDKDGNYLVIIQRGWGANIEMIYFYKNVPGNENWYGANYPITHWMELPKPPTDVDTSNLLGPNEVFIKTN